jgi:hypothetical protein
MSPATSIDQVQTTDPSTEGPSTAWHPAELSDRKLLELHRRLVRVQRHGDAFAHLQFSPQAAQRLRLILDQA